MTNYTQFVPGQYLQLGIQNIMIAYQQLLTVHKIQNIIFRVLTNFRYTLQIILF